MRGQWNPRGVDNLTPVESVMMFALGLTSVFRTLQVGNLHLATIVIFLLLLARFRHLERRTPFLLASALLFSVALLCASTIGSTQAVNAPLALQLAVLSIGAVALLPLLTRARVRMIFVGMLTGISASSAFAILQEFRVIPSQLFYDSSGLVRPTGLVGEPDWVGLFAAVALVILIRCDWVNSKLRFSLIALNGVALLFSFARAAWLAFIISFVVAAIISKVRDEPASRFRLNWKWIIGVGAISIAALVLLAPAAADVAWVRLLSIVSDDHKDANAIYRGQQLDALIRYGQDAPWHGYGLTASARVTIIGDLVTGDGVSNQNSVATNWFLALVADAKLLAIPFFVVTFILAVLRANSLGGQLFLIVVVNSLFSNVMYVPIWWLAVALAMHTDAHLPKHTVKQFSRRRQNNVLGTGSQ